ncbi:DUF4012 domain-containing protein [Leifsonia sp. F6_8S_P_1B]|uniref:DUF4012 domain-containing protein n=1 Tax=Leifsonia williamsii TaxID=3035919 RepID=A0ABT8KA22_9MICO|nr:DUF4012 domain-containing protein [Leifsonia williamsii]MDN4614303.1 DUF4012 domain-containing protein [Leifsonia williamsii]
MAVLLVLAVAAIVGWIGLRGVLARGELTAALPAAQAVKAAVLDGDIGRAQAAAADLRRHTDAAASLTGDPVWRAAEVVPWAGPNLAAVRVAAEAAQTVSAQVVQPLLGVARSADPRTLSITGGKVDLAPLIAAQPAAEKAQRAFADAERSVRGVDTGATLEPVASGVTRLRDFFTQTRPAIDAVATSARLLPPMLGADGPRQYLLVAQNPAELRSTGGLIGSIALVRADAGAVSLVAQASGSSIGPWPEPVSAVPDATQGLFGPLIGRYLQDANLTPDFPLAASTVSAMWTRSHGGTVDGVVALDPVVLSAVLGATGPVMLPTGEKLEAGTAVPLLLSSVYAHYAEPAQQDAFFASAAAAVFARMTGQGAAGEAVDGAGLVRALAASGASGRLLLWSAHPAEQARLAATSLAGGLPTSTASTAGVGVYFNDATGAKMDYYLATSVSAGAAVCRADGTPTIQVRVTLTNRAPADAGATLPAYVTGGGWNGVAPGSIVTRVAVYGPEGGLLASTLSDGRLSGSVVSGTDRSRPVSLVTSLLAPGQSKTFDIFFLGVGQKGTGVTVQTTPTLPGDGSTPDVGVAPPVGAIAVDCSKG